MGFKLVKKSSGGEVGMAAGQPVTAKVNPITLPEGQRETVRLSFRLGRDLHTRIKLEAVRRGDTIAGMVSRWIAETTPLA